MRRTLLRWLGAPLVASATRPGLAQEQALPFTPHYAPHYAPHYTPAARTVSARYTQGREIAGVMG